MHSNSDSVCFTIWRALRKQILCTYVDSPLSVILRKFLRIFVNTDAGLSDKFTMSLIPVAKMSMMSFIKQEGMGSKSHVAEDALDTMLQLSSSVAISKCIS